MKGTVIVVLIASLFFPHVASAQECPKGEWTDELLRIYESYEPLLVGLQTSIPPQDYVDNMIAGQNLAYQLATMNIPRCAEPLRDSLYLMIVLSNNALATHMAVLIGFDTGQHMDEILEHITQEGTLYNLLWEQFIEDNEVPF